MRQFRILLFALVLFCSCNKSDELLKASYFKLDLAIANGDFEQIYDLIDAPSKLYVDSMTDVENNSLSKVFDLGASNGLILFSCAFYQQLKEKIYQEDGREYIFKYLALREVSIFNFNEKLRLAKDGVQTSVYPHLVILNSQNKFNKVWFTKEDEGYRFNLLALLDIEEKTLKKIFKPYKNHPENKGLTYKELVLKYSKSYASMDAEVNSFDFKRVPTASN